MSTEEQSANKFIVYDSFNNALYVEESLEAAHERMDNWNKNGDVGDIMVFEVANIYRPRRTQLVLEKLSEKEIPKYFDNE